MVPAGDGRPGPGPLGDGTATSHPLVAGLSMLPAGLGVYEGTLTGLLVLQGVDPASAAAAALLYRGFNDLLMGMAGLPVVMVLDRARPGSSRPGVGREAAREVR